MGASWLHCRDVSEGQEKLWPADPWPGLFTQVEGAEYREEERSVDVVQRGLLVLDEGRPRSREAWGWDA